MSIHRAGFSFEFGTTAYAEIPLISFRVGREANRMSARLIVQLDLFRMGRYEKGNVGEGWSEGGRNYLVSGTLFLVPVLYWIWQGGGM